PDAVGSVSVFTPQNRFYYGRGEDIPVTVAVRAGLPSRVPPRVVLRLLDGARVVREEPLELSSGRAKFTIPAKRTEALPPGRYVLDARLPGFTTAAQQIEIGPGLPARPRFHVVQHGDYAPSIPPGPRPVPFAAILLPKLV